MCCWRVKEEGDVWSSCTRHHVHCLTTENVFHMNSEKKTTTLQSSYSASPLSACFWSVQIIFSGVLMLYFFFLDVQSPRHSFRPFYLTVKFDITAMIMSQTGVQWLRSAQSISTERQLTSWLLLLLHDLKSKSFYTTSLCSEAWSFFTATINQHNIIILCSLDPSSVTQSVKVISIT